MSNDTTITIVGNLTGDPELGFTPNGSAWARFSIAATPRRYDNNTSGWVDGDTLFLRCTAWRDLAEHVTESLHKGQRVIAAGRLRQSSWTTDTGETRTQIQLDIDEIGPSLRWATAKVTRIARTDNSTTQPTDDPWATNNTPPRPRQATAAGAADPPF